MSREQRPEGLTEPTASDRHEEMEGGSSEKPREHLEEIARLETRLKTETTMRNEYASEMSRLKGVVSDLNRDLQRSRDECEKKDDTMRQLETMLHHEQNHQREIKEEWTVILEDKDKQIRELRRCLEAQRLQMGQALEEHSKVGQDLSQMLERERREWQIELEILQSELNGTRQLIQEHQSVQEDSRHTMGSLQGELKRFKEEIETLKSLNAELMEENQELRNTPNNDSDQLVNAYEKEIEENVKEIAELKQRMSKFNDRLEEDYQRTDAQMAELRNKLANALQERDRLATEVHALTAKELRRKSVRSSSLSSNGAGNELAMAVTPTAGPERQGSTDAKLEELRFELEEERRTLALSREQMEEQIRKNQELEVELDQLKQEMFQIPFSSFARQYQRSDLDIIEHVFESILQLKETLNSVHSQSLGIRSRGSSTVTPHQTSSLTISIEEARHQLDTIRTTLEPVLGDRVERPRSESLTRRQRTPLEKKHRSRLSVSSWPFKSFSSKYKTSKVEELKEEMEELRRESSTLMHDKFALEQCVRYLSSRCQMYQLAWKAREGPRAYHGRGSSMSSRVEGISMSASSEIQPADRDEGEQPGIASMHAMDSGSSRAGRERGDSSPRLPRNLEMKLINKIAQVCDPFTIQTSETGRVGNISRPRTSRGVAV